LREWVVVKIFHSKPADVFQAEDSALPRVFEIWFTKSGSKPQSYKRCLAALKTLCPHLKIKH
jgi:hypothetical protein